MSFLRHQRSFRPMWQEQTGSRLGAHSRLSSARMSRSRLFLSGSVSTGARFRFIGCAQNAVQWSCRSSNLQRTANSVLFGCLSRRVHPMMRFTPLIYREEICMSLHTVGMECGVISCGAWTESTFCSIPVRPKYAALHAFLSKVAQSSRH